MRVSSIAFVLYVIVSLRFTPPSNLRIPFKSRTLATEGMDERERQQEVCDHSHCQAGGYEVLFQTRIG